MEASTIAIHDAGMATGGNRLACVVGLVVGALYLLNPTAGILEILPDNLPILGNLDEAGATVLVVRCLAALRASRGARPGP